MLSFVITLRSNNRRISYINYAHTQNRKTSVLNDKPVQSRNVTKYIRHSSARLAYAPRATFSMLIVACAHNGRMNEPPVDPEIMLTLYFNSKKLLSNELILIQFIVYAPYYCSGHCQQNNLFFAIKPDNIYLCTNYFHNY